MTSRSSAPRPSDVPNDRNLSMITDAARRVASLAGKSTELQLGRPSFQPKERYKSKDFDAGNFKPIKPLSGNPKIAFVDGGNLPVLETPAFSVHFERLYYNCFESGKRVSLGVPNRIEFFAVVNSVGDGDVRYETRLVPLDENLKNYLPDEKDLVFDSYDETLKTGLERVEISRVGNVARSFAEWMLASFVVNELDEGDIFVKDGTLHAPYTNETRYAEISYNNAKKKSILFCGVSKTSQLYTTTGLPIVAAIGRLARENKIKAPGYYENLVEITDPAHKADLNFARLHAKSDHTFRVEILQGQEKQKERIMAALAENSKDLSFPGYPYGLVDADKNARVSYDELGALRILLLSEIAKNKGFELFRDALLGSDAHDWLNRIV